MKRPAKMIALLLVSVLALGGCASSSYNLQSLAGVNMSDLEKARPSGKETVVSLPYPEAYGKIKAILEENKLTVFRESPKEKYIVAIGFPKQETTTRVGIFFDSLGEKETRITLSCLSSTCLSKAQNIIFGGLEN